MARDSKAMGSVKLRQAYVREGHNYLCMTVPRALAEAMSWLPGDELMFYPFRDERGFVGVKLVNMRNLLKAIIPDFWEEPVRITPEEWRGPKPGSIAARAQAIAQQTDEMEERASAAIKEQRTMEQAERRRREEEFEARQQQQKKAKRQRQVVPLSRRRPAG